MKQGLSALMVVIILAILGAAGYFVYKFFLPQITNVLPSGTPSPTQTTAPTTNVPQITTPKADATVTSPLTVRGIVPPGWMFEGVFPISIVDSNRKLIAEGQAKEELPGSWQSFDPVYFTATLNFATSAKSGFVVLENDNPSGDPANSKTFEIPVNF